MDFAVARGVQMGKTKHNATMGVENRPSNNAKEDEKKKLKNMKIVFV